MNSRTGMTMNQLSRMAIMGLMTAGASVADDQKTSEASFKIQCESVEGKISDLSCKGTSSCHGKVLHEDGKVEAISCAGKNSCKGVMCFSPKNEATAANFKESCEKNEGKIVDVSCKGHNTCKGIILQKGAISEIDCKGANSCKGIVCHIK
jgi:hypothetical protein